MNLLRDGIGNASYLEMFWTGLGAVALLMGLLGWREAWRNRRVLQRQADYIVRGPRDIQTRMNITSEQAKVLVQAGLLYVGVQAMFTPPRPDNNPSAVIASLIFIALEIVLTFLSVSERISQHELDSKLQEYRVRFHGTPGQRVSWEMILWAMSRPASDAHAAFDVADYLRGLNYTVIPPTDSVDYPPPDWLGGHMKGDSHAPRDVP